MKFLWVIAVCCLVFPSTILADIIMLKDGTRVEGTVANREQLAKNPSVFDHVSILPTGEEKLVQFKIAEIEYVLLIDGENKRVIELGVATQTPVTGMTEGKEEKSNVRRDSGVALMIGGAAISLFGVLVKFGDEQVTITPSDVDYDEKSYSKANYVLMASGAVIFLVGLALVTSNPSNNETAFIKIDQTSTIVGISLSF